VQGRAATILLLVSLTASVAAAGFAYVAWQSAVTLGEPHLLIEDVFFSRVQATDGRGMIRLRTGYRNTGRRSAKWHELVLVGLTPDMTNLRDHLRSVMANPLPPNSERMLTSDVGEPPPHYLAVCARWLDDNNRMGRSEWYFMLEPAATGREPRQYVETSPEELRVLKTTNPCGARNPW
jgi:hypothetical protein